MVDMPVISTTITEQEQERNIGCQTITKIDLVPELSDVIANGVRV